MGQAIVFPQYKTADQAAIAALKAILDRSLKEKREYAGWIIKLGNGKFSYTSPYRGTSDVSDPGSKPSGRHYLGIGTYHTHPGLAETDEIFSPQDKMKATYGNYYSWLGTPRRRILRYTPARLLPASMQKTYAKGHDVEIENPDWHIPRSRLPLE